MLSYQRSQAARAHGAERSQLEAAEGGRGGQGASDSMPWPDLGSEVSANALSQPQ